MAHKKAGGSVKNGRDSHSKRLGLKHFGGEHVKGGHIIVRQRGTSFHKGLNVGMGNDHTLYAKVEGIVHFMRKGLKSKRIVSVLPLNKTPVQSDSSTSNLAA